MNDNPIVIIGGGLIGVATAWELSRRGMQVVLLESRDEVALETSFANGALQALSMPFPWNSPGVYKQLMASIVNPVGSMRLRLRAFPAIIPWGLRFLCSSTASKYWATTEANYRLAELSVRQTLAVREELGVSYDVSESGSLVIFRDRNAIDSAYAELKKIARLGIKAEILDTAGTVKREPALVPIQDSLAGAIYFPGDVIGDAHLFCHSLARRVHKLGSEIRNNITVQRLLFESERVTGVETNIGVIRADKIIVAAGNQTPLLLNPLGISLPIIPVKGYSLTCSLPATVKIPVLPIIDNDMHAIAVTLGNRLRVAGIVEFSGFDKSIDPSGIEKLRKMIAVNLPEIATKLDESTITQWSGLRPVSADGRPFIGPTRIKGLYVTTGHGQLGWTLAMGSALILADVIEGKASKIPSEPFKTER